MGSIFGKLLGYVAELIEWFMKSTNGVPDQSIKLIRSAKRCLFVHVSYQKDVNNI